VLVVAGSDHFLGAPVLCAAGAARSGAGLVTVASTSAVRQTVAAHLPEATYTLRDVHPAADPREAAEALRPYLESHAAVVVGPGLGREPSTVRFVHELLRVRQEVAGGDHPALVLDADALYALSELDEWWRYLGPTTILTPHAGELARLCGSPPGEQPAWVQAGNLAGEWGCCLVAKGPFTCVARADGCVAVWPRANAALATGGTGDVLAGVCGGLLAQGRSAWDAARVGVAAHGLAAAHIVESRGWRTLLASDLLQAIPAALTQLAASRRR
jgi:NAD(P)H-hydrate epimerase